MAAKAKTPAKTKRAKHAFVDAEGAPLDVAKIKAAYRRVLKHHLGEVDGQTVYDPANPCGGVPFAAGEGSPICNECSLRNAASVTPFIHATGSDEPKVTVVFDGVGKSEDKAGALGVSGWMKHLKDSVEPYAMKTGVTLDEVRWVTLTRCCNQTGKAIDLRSAGQHCKLFFMQDLQKHPPKVIIPVGTTALGLLNYKSNAQDWQNRVLHWRGWPDDWLVNPDYVLPRPYSKDPNDPRTITGHPLFGPPPGHNAKILLYPVQHPRIPYMINSKGILRDYYDGFADGLALACKGYVEPNFLLPHYRLLTDPDEVERELAFLIDHPGIRVSYDTETEGLHPWTGQKIVFMMFRYDHPVTGEPVAFGFPWDYGATDTSPASELRPYLEDLKPVVLEALCASKIMGHNLTFDVLFTLISLHRIEDFDAIDSKGRVRDSWRDLMRILEGLADAVDYDTWHMAYCRLQTRGSLGLEMLAYDYAKHLAGYEEEMSLLIKLMPELQPDKGGHYARCPKDKWDSHFKSYVMGDVEVVHVAQKNLKRELEQSDVYRIPLAHPKMRGYFRRFRTPNRDWVYENIMRPANRTLIKMMGRGVRIDTKELKTLEGQLPREIRKLRDKIRGIKGGVVDTWCEQMRAEDPHKNDTEHPEKQWDLDLESKEQLRHILFDLLDMPVQRLTKTGRKLYGEEPLRWREKICAALNIDRNHQSEDPLDADSQQVTETLRNNAAVDKFTLNKLAVDFPDARVLLEYRKVHKLYTTYVRPLRNYRSALDKKARTAFQHLCPDGNIHAQFMLTGTRGGRLSCRDPNLQQLPKKGDVKKMYTSRFGKDGCLYGADFSQIELRLLAAASGDAAMVEAYEKDIDLHTLTTSRIFKLPYEHFSKDHMKWLVEQGKSEESKELSLKRDIGKTVNFLTGYGGGAMGLQTVLAGREIYRSIDECTEIIELFFESYPAVRDLLAFYKQFIEDNQCAVSIFGRVRQFSEVTSADRQIRSKALRAGCNHLIQSTASDMLLVCLGVIEECMREEGLDSILTLTVHDSLAIDARRSELDAIHDIVMTVLNDMPSVFKAVFGDAYDTTWMIVPFVGDADVGLNYGQMRPIGRAMDVDWDEVLDPRTKAE